MSLSPRAAPCLLLQDFVFYGHKVRAARINPRPVFVLGHPRTGTTLLHSLLAKDTEHFAFCNTFQAGFPNGFLTLEPLKWLLRPIMDDKRPMDNMDLGFDLPQEDEIATNVLSAGTSPYMPIVFMPQARRFFPFFTFRQASANALEQWTNAFLHLLRKLTVRHGEDRRLVLKSPVHTARIALLLKLFPDAQFIYLHRNPYEVFCSAVNMAG